MNEFRNSSGIAKVKAVLGKDLSRLLYFADEADVILVKPKQLLSKETFQALRRRIEKIGGQYVDVNTGFKIPKATLTEDIAGVSKPVEEPGVIHPEKPVGFEPETPMEPIPRTEDVLTTNIYIEDLETGVFSPRKSFGAKYIDQLAESIEREGQLKPIVVRPHPERPDVYQLIDGEHRVRALRKLGWSLIRAEVRTLSDEEASFLAMRINLLHGRRLEDLEEGLHIRKVMDKFGYTQTQIAEKFRKSQPWVSNRLSLANRLAPKTEEAFITRVITKSHARELAELPKEDQPTVVERVIKEGLSFKDTETLVHAVKSQPESKAEILTKPINELTPPPKEVEEFEKEKGPEQPKFVKGRCPQCGKEYVINWVLCRINWKEKSDHERDERLQGRA